MGRGSERRGPECKTNVHEVLCKTKQIKAIHYSTTVLRAVTHTLKGKIMKHEEKAQHMSGWNKKTLSKSTYYQAVNPLR